MTPLTTSSTTTITTTTTTTTTRAQAEASVRPGGRGPRRPLGACVQALRPIHRPLNACRDVEVRDEDPHHLYGVGRVCAARGTAPMHGATTERACADEVPEGFPRFAVVEQEQAAWRRLGESLVELL